MRDNFDLFRIGRQYYIGTHHDTVKYEHACKYFLPGTDVLIDVFRDGEMFSGKIVRLSEEEVLIQFHDKNFPDPLWYRFDEVTLHDYD